MSDRKIIAALFVSVDGVVDAANEFTSGYMDGEVAQWMAGQREQRDFFLLGRQTYQEMASYWPQQGTENPIAADMNNTPKLVVSNTLESVEEWQNSSLIKGDPIRELNRLKQQPGKNLLMIGSLTLARSLLRDGVVDELVLLIFPVVFGPGERLFEDGQDRIQLVLSDAEPFGNGVVKLTYTPAKQ